MSIIKNRLNVRKMDRPMPVIVNYCNESDYEAELSIREDRDGRYIHFKPGWSGRRFSVIYVSEIENPVDIQARVDTIRIELTQPPQCYITIMFGTLASKLEFQSLIRALRNEDSGVSSATPSPEGQQ